MENGNVLYSFIFEFKGGEVFYIFFRLLITLRTFPNDRNGDSQNKFLEWFNSSKNLEKIFDKLIAIARYLTLRQIDFALYLSGQSKK